MTGGGAERAILEIVNNLDRSIYKPKLVLFDKFGPYLKYLKHDIDIIEISGCTGFFNTFNLRKAIKSLIDKYEPELFVSFIVGINRSVLRSIVNCSYAPPAIVCEQNNLTFSINKLPYYFSRQVISLEVKFLYKKAARIIAVSHGIKNDMINNYGMAQKKIAVIHNSVDSAMIQKMLLKDRQQSDKENKEIKKIISVGRLTEQKGLFDLIKSFAVVRKSIPAKLTILGEGELRSDLEKLVGDLGLDGDVHMPGFLDNPWAVIKKADVFVLSSHWEGFGNVIVEAMVCGTPVISTDCDYGPREIITHGHDGMLVPVGDVHAMSKIIIDLLTDEQLRHKLADNAKETVKRFDSRIVTRQYEQLFEDVLSKK